MTGILDRISIRQKFLINLDNFKVIKKISSGGFGRIYEVQDKKSKEKFAAKIIDAEDENEQIKKMINREIGIMIRLKHQTLVQFYGYALKDFDDHNNVTIIMNLAENSSLASLLQEFQKGLADISYNNTARQKILIGIARGMMYLHKNHIIHRDLKPDNILLDSNYQPLITDFGLSKIYENGRSQYQTQSYGTSIYMAPEVIQGTNYNGKADVYSFSIIMYEILTDTIPFPLFQNQEITLFQFNSKIVNEKYRPEFTSPIKESLKKLIIQCWSADPKDRPTFEEIFNKLAFNLEESVYDIFDDDNEYKYYLDDVDVDDVLCYAYDLIEDEHNCSSDNSVRELKKENEDAKKHLDDQDKLIKKLANENQKNAQKIQDQNDVIAGLSNDNKMLKKENEQIRKQLNDMLKRIEELETRLPGIEPPNSKPKPIKEEPEHKTKSKSKLKGELVFSPKNDSSFNGIMDYFINNADIEDKVEISSSSQANDKYPPSNVVIFNDKDKWFESDCMENNWIRFSFKANQIILTHYKIMSYYGNEDTHQPKSWVIEGSNNNKSWEEIDRQDDCSILNSAHVIHLFPISKEKHMEFKHIRMRLTGPNWWNDDFLKLNCFELYGKVI